MPPCRWLPASPSRDTLRADDAPAGLSGKRTSRRTSPGREEERNFGGPGRGRFRSRGARIRETPRHMMDPPHARRTRVRACPREPHNLRGKPRAGRHRSSRCTGPATATESNRLTPDSPASRSIPSDTRIISYGSSAFATLRLRPQPTPNPGNRDPSRPELTAGHCRRRCRTNATVPTRADAVSVIDRRRALRVSACRTWYDGVSSLSASATGTFSARRGQRTWPDARSCGRSESHARHAATT